MFYKAVNIYYVKAEREGDTFVDLFQWREVTAAGGGRCIALSKERQYTTRGEGRVRRREREREQEEERQRGRD